MAEHHQKLASCLRGDERGLGSPYDRVGDAPGPGASMDDGFPDSTWRDQIKGWAEGRNRSSFWSSAEESAVIAANTALANAMASPRMDVKATQTTQALEKLLQKPPAVVHANAEQSQLKQSITVVESMVAIANDPRDAQNTLLAVAGLSPEAQRRLLMADEMTGNRLYQSMHRAMKEYAAQQVGKLPKDRDLPDLGRVFSDVRAGAQVASSLVRMNRRDPSGTEARLTRQFVDHLQASGVSWDAQKAFANKLDFKSRVANSHGSDADLASIESVGKTNGLVGDGKGRFTGQLYAALAETPGVGEDELAKAMNLPPGDLVRLTAESALRNREGDRRIVKVVSQAVNDDVVVTRNAKLKDLNEVLGEVSGGRYSPTKFADMASKGETAASMSATLKKEAQDLAANRSDSVAKTMNTVLTKMAQRRDFLKEHLKTLDGDAKIKAQNLHDDLDAFVTRFPPDQFTKEKLLPVFEKFGSNMTGPTDPFKASGMTPTDEKVDSMFLRGFMAFTRQVSGHQAALQDPTEYAKGLDRLVPVVPTAGRDLSECPWMGSTAADMARTAALIQNRNPRYSLEKTPMLVFDQTDAKNPDLWAKNEAYCRELERQYAASGLKVVHVSMADVRRLGGPGLQKMFDTTGEGYAGYGGARNMAYMLGPMIRYCENNGIDWKNLTADQALPLIQQHSLERSSAKFFMGDDTDQVSEGTILAKSVLALEHEGEYGLAATMRDGRNTMVVSEIQTNQPSLLLAGGLDAFVSNLNGGNSWQPRAKAAGMGCTVSDARFCLDLPLGAEEKHHEAMKSSIDNFSKASHLASDRQRDFGTFFEGHLSYTNTTGMAKSLLREAHLPWNEAHATMDKNIGRPKFDSLQSVLTYSADPVQAKQAQQGFFAAMAEWRAQNPAQSGALTLDVTPAQARLELAAKLENAVRGTAEATAKLKEAVEAKQNERPAPLSGSDRELALNRAIEKAKNDLKNAETLEANCRKHKALLDPAYENAPPEITTANAAIVDYYLKQHPELKPEDRAQLLKVQGAYETAGKEMQECRKYMDKLLDELVPATRDTKAGSKLPEEDLKRALAASLAGEPPDKAAVAIAKVKREMEAEGTDFSKNRHLRDLNLMTQSVGGGGFVSLAKKLHTPVPRLEIGVLPQVVRREGPPLGAPELDPPRSGILIEPSRDPSLGAVVSSVGTTPSRSDPSHPEIREPIDFVGLGLGEGVPRSQLDHKVKEKEPLSTREALAQSGYKPRSPSTGGTGQKVTTNL
ncbi:hypothetical protein [Roseimicrobium sp. ORNL1]|uniref:hypothetical protein n=1 Tax=Roseimicrobium sp. ORNL1 TaxID=2711231 RepID=UPI0013E198CC|nr:hypothetical protein [Roseimicrobium sp. ORNL1]QIF03968.1 hypothetical protein G5S37_21360 [Roseimicrobium sp. ORNL1]